MITTANITRCECMERGGTFTISLHPVRHDSLSSFTRTCRSATDPAIEKHEDVFKTMGRFSRQSKSREKCGVYGAVVTVAVKRSMARKRNKQLILSTEKQTLHIWPGCHRVPSVLIADCCWRNSTTRLSRLR